MGRTCRSTVLTPGEAERLTLSIGDGAGLHLAGFAEGLAEEDSGWGVAIGDRRHAHDDKITQ